VKALHARDSEKALLEITRAILVLVVLFSPSVAWSQAQNADQSDAPEDARQNSTPPSNSASAPQSGSGKDAVPDQAPSPQDNQDDSKGKQTKRLLWVVPNFGAVDANTQLPAMSTREKFVLAAHGFVQRLLSTSGARPEPNGQELGNTDGIRRPQSRLPGILARHPEESFSPEIAQVRKQRLRAAVELLKNLEREALLPFLSDSTQKRPDGFRHPSLSPDHFSEVVGMHVQLEHC
jgi:hypothetical protein